MTDVDRLLRELAETAQDAPVPAIDVRSRVLSTLASRSRQASLDVLPIAFAGAAVTVAAILLIMLLPLWRTMTEPWAAYLP